MEVPSRQPRVNNFMAIPLTSIYAQSWPVPRPDVMVTNNSFSSGRSLNDGWIRSPTKLSKGEPSTRMHHFNNEGIASPALRRSQLAAALSRREIPATQAPYEAIIDLGPTMNNMPATRQERPNSSTCHVYTRQPSAKRATSAKAMEREREKKLREADELAKEEWIKNDVEFEELFVPEEIDPDDMDFKFHDPYPRTWVDETVETVCFRGSRKADPFMHRLDELEDVQEETVLWEKLNEEKAKQTFTTLQTKLAKSTSKKGNCVRGGSARCATGRTSAGVHVSLSRAKSSGNRIKRTSSACRSSTTSNGVSGSEESDITTFRNSGYDMGVSFKPGSMYPETRPKLKGKTADGDLAEKPKAAETSSVPFKSPPAQLPRSQNCEACQYRKTAGKRKTRNCKSAAPTLQSMRKQYTLKATECYDIVDLAHTFDPPCKSKMDTTKTILSTEEKAAKKGLVPGKSTHSQRRISLTSEGMAVRGINPVLNFLQPQTGRSKSAKASVRCKKSLK
ncbi:hypothetical protein QZH41_001540 [Actinostola sp. cb2023]|nr:hypothetical protein QZH41_001540 [Actinostola sp. cb2023]